jgi:hypothetical protein
MESESESCIGAACTDLQACLPGDGRAETPGFAGDDLTEFTVELLLCFFHQRGNNATSSVFYCTVQLLLIEVDKKEKLIG